MPCNNFPIKYGFMDKLFFEAMLNICKNIEKPANPSRKAHTIICVDIVLLCKEDTELIPFVNSKSPVIIALP